MFKIAKILIVLSMFSVHLWSNTQSIDSLKEKIIEGVDVYHNAHILSVKYNDINLDSSLKYAELSLVNPSNIVIDSTNYVYANNLVRVYQLGGQYDKSLDIYHSLISYCKINKREIDLSAIYGNLGLLYQNMNNYKKSIHYFNESLKIDKKNNNIIGELYNILDIAYVYIKESKYSDALKLYQEALKKVNKENETNEMLSFKAMIYEGMGQVYYSLSSFNKALGKYLESVRIYQSINQEEYSITVYENISELYLARKEYSKAMEYLEKAGDFYFKRKDWKNIIDNKVRKAKTYLDLNQELAALKIIDEITEINKTRDNTYDYAYTYDLKGLIYSKKENYEESLNNYKKSLEYFKLLKDSVNISIQLNNVGFSTYLLTLNQNNENEYGKTKLSMKNNYKKSLRYVNEAIEISKSLGSTLNLQEQYLSLSKIYEAMGKNQEALKSYKKYIEFKDLVLDNNNQREYGRLEERHKMILKNQEIENNYKISIIKKNAVIDAHKSNIYILVTVLLGIMSISILLYLRHKSLKKMNNVIKEVAEQKQEIFSMLAHDVKSTINISSKILDIVDKNEIDENTKKKYIHETKKSILKVDTLIENILAWVLSEDGQIKLFNEKLNIWEVMEEVLFDFEIQLKNKNINLDIIHESVYQQADKFTLNMIFSNIISNSIKYSNKDSVIRIELTKEYLQVENTGIAIDPDQLDKYSTGERLKSKEVSIGEKGHGLGLGIIKKLCSYNKLTYVINSENTKTISKVLFN